MRVAAMALAIALASAACGSTGTDTTVAPPPPITTPPRVPLATNPDPLLHHPGVLPVGAEQCADGQFRWDEDRFCGPSDAWYRVTIPLDPFVPNSAQQVDEIARAFWLSREEPLKVAVAAGNYWINAEAKGIAEEDFLEMVATSPIIADPALLSPFEEAALNLDTIGDEDLGGVIDGASVRSRRIDRTVVSDGIFVLTMHDPEKQPLLDMAMEMERPGLAAIGNRSGVVSTFDTRSEAVWSQRGHTVELEANVPLDDLLRVGATVVLRIEALAG